MTPTTQSRLRSLLDFLNRSDGTVAVKTARSGVWAGISNFVSGVLRFLTSIVLARLLAPEDFGLIGIALFFFKVFDVMSQPGLSAAIIYRTDRVQEAIDAAWSALLIRGVILSGLTAAVAPLVAWFYDEPTLTRIIRVVAVVFVIRGCTNSYLILLRKNLKFKRLTILEVSVAVLNALVVVSVAFVLRNVWALVVGQISMTTLRVIISYVIVETKPRFVLARQMVAELFRYGKFVTGTTIVTFLSTGIDNALVGKVLGTEPLGHYVVAYALATLPASLVIPVLQKVLFPAFSQLQDDLRAFRASFLRVLKIVATAVVPMAVGLAVLAPQIVESVYGRKWLPMVPSLYVLCLLGATQCLIATMEPVLLASGRPQVSFYLSSAKLAVVAVLLYPLTVAFGIQGTALAVTLPACAELLVLSTLLRRQLRCRIGRMLRGVLLSVAASSVMAILIQAAKALVSEVRLTTFVVLCVTFGAVIYTTILVVFDRELREAPESTFDSSLRDGAESTEYAVFCTRKAVE